MKRLIFALGPALLLSACSGLLSDSAESGEGHGAGTVQFTHYSNLTEAFAEHRPLVAERKRRFDVHLSWLADYRAVGSGTLTVELVWPDGKIDQGSAGVSETPGIFRVLVAASKPGKPKLRLTLVADGQTSVHDLGPVQVYTTREEAEKANPEPAPNPRRIAFSKEAQWKIPFGTAPSQVIQLEESVPVSVDVRFAPDAEAVIAAPLAGIVRVNGAVPAPGTPVRAGQTLGAISIKMGEGTQLAGLDGEVAEAQIAVQAAQRELTRLQGLYRQEAVPLRRVQEAETTLRLAQARLAAASRQRRTVTSSDTSVALVSPISGRIVASHMVRGGSVEQGKELLRIGDPSRIWLVARVPEALAARVINPSGIDVIRDGKAESLNGIARLVQAGTFVDPASRTMDVIFSVDGGQFKPGTRLSGRLRLGGGAAGLAVPASAVIDEGGQTVVYVQVAGETFERRIVVVGTRSGEMVGVTGDLKPGERVVTIGAAAVRAAAATPDAFGHGHAH